jgi:hypothetical protein
MNNAFAFAFLAALNPTLLTATTVMLLLPNPRRLMLGYLAGAMLMSITIGMLLVFSLDGSGAATTTKNSLSPAAKIAMGLLALAVAWALQTGRDARVTERRRAKTAEKGEPRWREALGKGDPRLAFVVGAMLTLPGVSYLIGMHRIHLAEASTGAKAASVVLFNVIMLMLLEGPLLSFLFAPDWTHRTIARLKAWVAARGRHVAIRALLALGVIQILRGVAELL